MTREPETTIRRLTPGLLDDYLAFFDGPAFADNPEWADCYCYFPYFDGGEAAWLKRSAADNRTSSLDAITSGQADGFLAYAGERVVGWVSAAPRERFGQLTRLPADGGSMGATPCFLIHPEWRGRGLAARLLRAAIEGFRADGMARMAAGPATAPQSDAEAYRGTVGLFEAAGYSVTGKNPDGTTLMEKEL